MTTELITPFGIEEEYSNEATSKYHIICAPFAQTVTYLKGAEKGPNAILEASTQVELYDERTETEPYRQGITRTDINPYHSIEKVLEDIEKAALKALKSDKFPILLGGEHSVTHGMVKAMKQVYPDLCILHIDAHADLKEEYEGNKFNHACALRHAFEDNIPITQIGIRSLTKEEHDLIKENPDKLTTFFANEAMLDVEAVLNSLKSKNVYITIDLDGFDPSIIPHVGTPEPGGLLWYEVITVLEELYTSFNVVGADIVELAPSENSTVSDFSAAKLLYKLMAYKK